MLIRHSRYRGVVGFERLSELKCGLLCGNEASVCAQLLRIVQLQQSHHPVLKARHQQASVLVHLRTTFSVIFLKKIKTLAVAIDPRWGCDKDSDSLKKEPREPQIHPG